MSFDALAVLAALQAQPRKSAGQGRALMVLGAQASPATTELSRGLAEAAGPGAVYAIDLDLRRNALGKSFAASGGLGPPIDGALNGASFCALLDENNAVLPARFRFHRLGRSRLFVGALDARGAPARARIRLSQAPNFWDAARAGGATVVVDAPALERTRAALRVARHMDGVVLAVSDAEGAVPAAQNAKAALAEAGANLIGLVYVGASAPVLALERALRQAG